VAVIGCGGLGSTAIALLARSGVGSLVIVDRDVVDMSNLHRQLLYEEADAHAAIPKALAAAAAVARMNSEVRVRAVAADVRPANIESIIDGCSAVIDATDKFATATDQRRLLHTVLRGCTRPSAWRHGHDDRAQKPRASAASPAPPPGSILTCEVGVLPSTVVSAAPMDRSRKLSSNART
jgi:adenylyltransferase/sulfurtransferase